jgi:predicted AAA+ superfamily ATPase
MVKDDAIQFLQRSQALSYDRLLNYVQDGQGTEYPQRWIFVKLKKYLDRFIAGETENRWITIPGFRGVGKTTILAQMYFHLLRSEKVPRENVFYFSMDAGTIFFEVNLKDIIPALEVLFGTDMESLGEKVFLFIDEIHYDPTWAAALKSIYDRTRNIFVIATGSSALALQTSTDAARRTQIEKMMPLNFPEYIMLKERVYPAKGLKEGLGAALFSSDSSDAAYSMLEKWHPAYLKYWTKVRPMEEQRYLRMGSMPFALKLDEKEAFERSLQILEKVIYGDIPNIYPFKKETLDKVWRMLILLSTAEKTNYETLAQNLSISKDTVSNLINSLIKAEILFPVKPFGSTEKIVRKSWKFGFVSPAVKSSLMWSVGKLTQDSKTYGSLLENLVAFYLYRMKITRRSFDIFYDPEKGGVDFILKDLDTGCGIPIEVGYGKKDPAQVKRAVERYDARYGLLVSGRGLDRIGDVITVPKRMFYLL